MWYNEKENLLQLCNPSGRMASQSYMKKHYPDWIEVPNDFRPPIIEVKPTKEELLKRLNDEYEKGKQELASAYLDAVLHSDTEQAEAIKEEIASLDAKYDTDYHEIFQEEE